MLRTLHTFNLKFVQRMSLRRSTQRKATLDSSKSQSFSVARISSPTLGLINSEGYIDARLDISAFSGKDPLQFVRRNEPRRHPV